MQIRDNPSARRAGRYLSANQGKTAKTLQKLSSGYRINQASDDAAGLAVSEKMRAAITGVGRASANSKDGISLVQVADGALQETHAMLQRMNDLAMQSMNDTYTGAERQALDQEFQQLSQEINRISQGTNFNGIPLLDGSLKRPQATQIIELTNRSAQAAAEGGKAAARELVALDKLGSTLDVVDAKEAASLKAAARAAAAPTPPTGAATAISGTGYTIAADGVYELAAGFTGVIDVPAGAKVLIRQADPNTALNNVTIQCGAGAELHIEGLNIENSTDINAIDFTGGGNKLNTIGDNKIVSTAQAIWNTGPDDVDHVTSALVHTGPGTELELWGTGTLSLKSADYTLQFGIVMSDAKGACMGGNSGKCGGTITVQSGSYVAELGRGAEGAGIGGGYRGDAGIITVEGGSIKIDGKFGTAACIGSGSTSKRAPVPSGEGNKITINGGSISASGGNGAAIGGGYGRDGGNILVTGGDITVTGTNGAGIGGGWACDGGNITITGGKIVADTVGFGAGIGGGHGGSGGQIEIRGGELDINASHSGAGIGGGCADNWGSNNGGNITIKNGTIVITNSGSASGIGVGGTNTIRYQPIAGSSGGTLQIEGGNVTINSDPAGSGAAIGGGGGCYLYEPNTQWPYHQSPASGADVTLSGGTLTINTGWIGGGNDFHNGINHYAPDGTLNVTGGTLNYTDPRVDGPHHPTTVPPVNPPPPVDPDDPNPPVDPDNPDPSPPRPGPDFTAGGLILHIGESSEAYDYLHIYIEDMTTTGLGFTDVNVLTREHAETVSRVVRGAINQVSLCRASLGAYQNRLEHNINHLGATLENTTESNSRIRDADMAEEIMDYTKHNILNQSAQAMLSQAQQQPQSVLQLLQ